MKVLVTGGTGYLGRAVVSALAARGHDLVVFARSATRSGLPGAAIDGDIRDRPALERAAAGCDANSHSAALSASGGAPRGLRRRQRGRGCETCWRGPRARDAARSLYVVVRRDPSTKEGPSRWSPTTISGRMSPPTGVADEAVRDGLPLIRVYPESVYGAGSFTEGNPRRPPDRDHLAHKLPGLVGPENRWSYAYVDDVAAGHCAALERGRSRWTVRARRRETRRSGVSSRSCNV
jgi:nucleoside-diphosphate-sugar epimerase